MKALAALRIGPASQVTPNQAGPVGSPERMDWLRARPRPTVITGRCQGCGKQLADGEPLVKCGPRRFICAKCSNAEHPLRCWNCRRTVTGQFGFRTRYCSKSAMMCFDCRGRSRQKGLPAKCCGCLETIPADEALVVVNRRRICRTCADATRPFHCKRCHRITTGEYVYLHVYVGNQRNPVCGQCSAEIEAARA